MGVAMKKVIKLVIDLDDTDNMVCGDCFSKTPVLYGSGQPEYKCSIFSVPLIKTKGKETPSGFGKFSFTDRCSDCLLVTETKKSFMVEPTS
jgi:hypothetical protein